MAGFAEEHRLRIGDLAEVERAGEAPDYIWVRTRLAVVDRVGHVGHAHVLAGIRIHRGRVVAGHAVLDRASWTTVQIETLVAVRAVLRRCHQLVARAGAAVGHDVHGRIVGREFLGCAGHADLEAYAVREARLVGDRERRRHVVEVDAVSVAVLAVAELFELAGRCSLGVGLDCAVGQHAGTRTVRSTVERADAIHVALPAGGEAVVRRIDQLCHHEIGDRRREAEHRPAVRRLDSEFHDRCRGAVDRRAVDGRHETADLLDLLGGQRGAIAQRHRAALFDGHLDRARRARGSRRSRAAGRTFRPGPAVLALATGQADRGGERQQRNQ